MKNKEMVDELNNLISRLDAIKEAYSKNQMNNTDNKNMQDMCDKANILIDKATTNVENEFTLWDHILLILPIPIIGVAYLIYRMLNPNKSPYSPIAHFIFGASHGLIYFFLIEFIFKK